MSDNSPSSNLILEHDFFLAHWQGQRRLTRRVIEAFPADQLFAFQPAPPMRSFGKMMVEVVGMVEPTFTGFESGNWGMGELGDPNSRLNAINDQAALLAAWDGMTELLEREWPKIAASRLLESEAVYGMPEQPRSAIVFYLLDNEVHHRAQGYVYLRLLGIEPPAFYMR
jgi:uncharacterized damage-inducible protein DinB